jgi:hypothetical protein
MSINGCFYVIFSVVKFFISGWRRKQFDKLDKKSDGLVNSAAEGRLAARRLIAAACMERGGRSRRATHEILEGGECK